MLSQLFPWGPPDGQINHTQPEWNISFLCTFPLPTDISRTFTHIFQAPHITQTDGAHPSWSITRSLPHSHYSLFRSLLDKINSNCILTRVYTHILFSSSLTFYSLPHTHFIPFPTHILPFLAHILFPCSLTFYPLPHSHFIAFLAHILSPSSLTFYTLPHSHFIPFLTHISSPSSLTFYSLPRSHFIPLLAHILFPSSLTFYSLPWSHFIPFLTLVIHSLVSPFLLLTFYREEEGKEYKKGVRKICCLS